MIENPGFEHWISRLHGFGACAASDLLIEIVLAQNIQAGIKVPREDYGGAFPAPPAALSGASLSPMIWRVA